MAQQLPHDAEGPSPSNYRELYAAVVYQAGEPAPDRLVATSYPFAKVAGGGKRPTPAKLREQTFVAFSDRQPKAFLSLARSMAGEVQ
jgi:hypothetical protein